MAQLPLDEGVNRFQQNEERIDKFVNDPTGYVSSTGQNVESIPAFLERIESEISATGAIAITEANKDAALAAQSAAGTASDTAAAARDTALTHKTDAETAKNTAQAIAAGFGAGIIGKATKALLDADLAYAADKIALVTNDTTITNNGFYRKTGASGSGSWVKGDDSWVSALSITGPLAFVPHDTTIKVDMAAKTITGGGGIVIHHKGYKTIPANQSVAFDYPANSAGYLMYMYVDLATGALGIVSLGMTPSTPPVNSVVLGYIYNQRFYGNDPAGRVRVIPTTYTSGINGGADWFACYTGSQITINRQTKTVSVVGGGFATHKGAAVNVAANQSVSWSFQGSPGYIAVRPDTGALVVTDASTLPPAGFPALGVCLLNKFYTASPAGAFRFIDEAGKDQVNFGLTDSSESLGLVGSDCSITINLQTKTLSFDSSGVVMGSSNYVTVSTQSVSFNYTSPTYLMYFHVNKATGALGVTEATAIPPSNVLVFAIVYIQKLHAHDPFGRIKLYDANGNLVTGAASDLFSETSHRMILPEDMYFRPSTPLALFKAPCLSAHLRAITSQIQLWLNTKGSSIADRFQHIGEVCKLDPSQLGADFEVGFRHESKPDVRYIKPITKHVAGAGALNGRSLKMLVFGDSLTETGMASAFKTNLEAQGATITPVGTYFSVWSDNLRGEGRGYWNYRSFIGKDNFSGGIGSHTRSPGGKTDTTKFENPFLKLADATDKANHPDWCFRFTGADRELSYTEDPNKAGDFFIFDFAWYMAQHSVPAPDFITIALSTNDINLDTGTYTKAERLQYMRLGLEVMVKQIKAAVPAVKIGIIPAPAWSSTSYGDSRWSDETSEWVEWCMKDVKVLQATYSGLYVVPVWPFMSEDWVFPYSSSTDLSSTNTTKKKTITDWVHFDEVGRLQYAEVVGAWVANVV